MAAPVAVRPANRIGPNAITQTCAALQEHLGMYAPTEFLLRAGLAHYIDEPPTGMVDEADVNDLMRAIVSLLSPREAELVLQSAGRRTGDYILAHRIPRVARGALLLAPAPLAARLLLAAIERHAWTFAGSGVFSWRVRRSSATLRVSGCPICRGLKVGAPTCDFYAGTFQRLFARLVAPVVTVRETSCAAAGGSACEFLVEWRGRT